MHWPLAVFSTGGIFDFELALGDFQQHLEAQLPIHLSLRNPFGIRFGDPGRVTYGPKLCVCHNPSAGTKDPWQTQTSKLGKTRPVITRTPHPAVADLSEAACCQLA